MLLGATIASLSCANKNSSVSDGVAAKPPVHSPPMSPPSSATTKDAFMTLPLHVSWTLERQSDALALQYTIKNDGNSPVYVLDQTLVFAQEGLILAPDKIIVDSNAGILQFTRGYIRPLGDYRVQLIPAVRKLKPAGSLQGSAQISLPVAAWHPRDGSRPLLGNFTKGVLRIGYVPGDTPLVPRTLVDGTTVQIPPAAHMDNQKFIESEHPVP